MTSRAVHLELAADASTKSFLAALDRFCGRRGTPSRIYSDNGSNFRGGAAELRLIMKDHHSDDGRKDTERWSAAKGLRWYFQPACSPSRGGLWEAGVKTMKGLIRQTLYKLSLTIDELNTIVISAEAVMNSRPYLPVHSTDPDGVCPLTPGHFLVGRPLCALPMRVDTESKVQNVRHWELVKRMEYQHWKEFRHTYLPQLAARAKEMVAQTNLQVNDVVLVADLKTKRTHWPLGLVVAIYPGPDGLVQTADVRVETSRTADAKISTTTFRRAVQLLVKMPIDVT